jgi:heme-degrading monooxygenase HmoA
MAIISRHIIVKAPPNLATEIQRVWKQACAPLMIQQPGCLREQLLHCREELGEFISVAEWESPEAIERYLDSPEHEQIKQHARQIVGSARGTNVVVKTCELVGE